MLATDSQVHPTASIYPSAPRSAQAGIENLQALIDIPLEEALSWARLRAAELLVELCDPDLERLLDTQETVVELEASEDVAAVSLTPSLPVTEVSDVPPMPPPAAALPVPPAPPVRSRVTASAVLHPVAASPVPAVAPPKPKPMSPAAASRRRERAAEHTERMARRLRRQFASRQAVLGHATPSPIRAPARTTAVSEPDPPALTTALALIEARRWKDAIGPLEEALRLRPSQKLRALLGVVHARRAAVERDFPSARRHYESVLALVPGHAVAQRELLMISAVSG